MDFISKRKSIRKFSDKKIPKDDIQYILENAMRAPSYFNSQIISLIAINNKDKLKDIAELCGGQNHIAEADTFVVVLIDYYRLHHLLGNVNILNNIEGMLIGSHDAGILVSQLQLLASSLGYGSTVIGAVRANADKLIKYLELPKYTFPILGTTIGIPHDDTINIPLKPRMDYTGTIFYDSYNKDLSEKAIDTYDDKITKHYIDTNSSYIRSYNEIITKFFTRELDNKTKNILNEQGFYF